ncbi:aspartate/glutamate racemase family protein [uncultured Pelagimonas sp.]|uniref:aspartate/glutamate racemase family protein n=1 Tax=uncultured Pelagimonas sp. TaxID=1618102 RepID=UPI00261935FB|nr:aspartate/glutamate racemase family protein [uncultured Pelagimonas sp.]
MHLVYINPNATEAMTKSVVSVAAKAVPEVKVSGLTNTKGPAAIEGPQDGAAAIPGVLEYVAEAQALGADAIVIACFDDTGLAEARNLATCPVLGIGHSAYTIASLLGGVFSVVTSVEAAVPVIEGNIKSSGFGGSCAQVHASRLAVLAIEQGGVQMLDQLAQAIVEAKAQSKCATVVLGCAGMAMYHGVLTERTGATLIDGVVASTHLAVAAALTLAGKETLEGEPFL